MAHSSLFFTNRTHSGTDLIMDGWFHERGVLWPGQAMSLKVEEVLYHGKSKYQDVLVFKSHSHGKW
jgi:spermidine synthase